MIELVVFDMAGTTVNDGDAVGSSFRATLAARGLQIDPAVVKTVMGLPKPEAIRILLEKSGKQSTVSTAEQIHAMHEDFTRRMRNYYATDPAVREVPGAAGVFATLRRAGIKVALNTGFFRLIAEVLLAEIAKCDLVCANCHRVRTYKRKMNELKSTEEQAAVAQW